MIQLISAPCNGLLAISRPVGGNEKTIPFLPAGINPYTLSFFERPFSFVGREPTKSQASLRTYRSKADHRVQMLDIQAF